MSYLEAKQPVCTSGDGTIAMRIDGRERRLGDLTVRRVLPSRERQMVGPFIFFDHIGPAEFPPGQGIQVRPHPHIGLATITYLFEGEMMHRDSLGYVQPIRTGDVNLMTAGRGIVHSERAGDDLDRHSTLHGIQSWLALPDGKEEIAPAFEHYPANDLPVIEIGGVKVTVIIGNAYERQSPVDWHTPVVYLECIMPKGTMLELPNTYRELAAYVVDGQVSIDDEPINRHVLAVGAENRSVCLQASEDSRVMVIGGDPVGKRHIWWNFVSRTEERMEQAKDDWKNGRFDGVPGDDEIMPLRD